MKRLRAFFDRSLLRRRMIAGWRLLFALLKWILAGGLCGVAGGLLGAAFHHAVHGATDLFARYHWILWLLPVGGVLTVLAYRLSNTPLNVDLVLRSVRSDEPVPPLMAPLIFFGATLAQLVGGSAGKEGAALQMGGALGYQVARLLRLDPVDTHTLIMCGMSALFSAVFLTPLAAAIFAIEVVSVGIFYFSALVPCLTAALTACVTAKLVGVHETLLPAFTVPALSPVSLLGAAGLGLACAAVAILFCISLNHAGKHSARWLKNDLVRALVLGALVVAMTYAVGNRNYNGTGMNLVVMAVGGQAPTWAFLLKILFTAITIASGLRGGEIVPTMAIGATLGCTFGILFGFDPGFCAAVGLTAMFCAMVNCPITSLILGLELFGTGPMVYMAVACSISFVLSGNYSLYSGQKLPYSKIRAEYTNSSAHH